MKMMSRKCMQLISIFNFFFFYNLYYIFNFRICKDFENNNKNKKNHNAFDNFKALCNENKIPCKSFFKLYLY